MVSSFSVSSSSLGESEMRYLRNTMAIMIIAATTIAIMVISMGVDSQGDEVFVRFIVVSVVWPAVTVIVTFAVSYPDFVAWMV